MRLWLEAVSALMLGVVLGAASVLVELPVAEPGEPPPRIADAGAGAQPPTAPQDVATPQTPKLARYGGESVADPADAGASAAATVDATTGQSGTVLPGIVQAGPSGCPSGYLPVASVCYHGQLNQAAGARRAQIEAWRRGQSPPLVEVMQRR